MSYNKDTVLKFIDQFKDTKDFFLNGKCYWFARILYERFNVNSTCRIMYNQIDNHFACEINKILYDASGVISNNGFVSWKNYKYDESSDSIRLYRDCILYCDPVEEALSEKSSSYYIFSRHF